MIVLIIILLFYIVPIILSGLAAVCFDKNRSVVGGRQQQRTFLYIGDQLQAADIAARLPGWHAVNISSRPKFVDLVMATGPELSDKRLFAIKSTLKCRMDSKEITDKVKFHHHVATLAPELIAKTIDVDCSGDNAALFPGTWMIRANWGWGGKAAAVATSAVELKSVCEQFAHDNPFSGRQSHIIASEYIADPMLYYPTEGSDGHKFHLRIYMLCTIIAGERRLSMLRNGLIIPAHLPYVASDWSNAEIHDTHGRDNRGLGRFPRDIAGGTRSDNPALGEHMTGQIVDAMRRAVVPLLPKINVYSESKNGYEMLGADIMFCADGTIKIIEVNDAPGLTWLAAHPEGAEAAAEITDWLFSETVGRVFPDVPHEFDGSGSVQLYPSDERVP